MSAWHSALLDLDVVAGYYNPMKAELLNHLFKGHPCHLVLFCSIHLQVECLGFNVQPERIYQGCSVIYVVP